MSANSPSVPAKRPTLPPRWVMRAAWAIHRALLRISGDRIGLALPGPQKFGTMRLRTLGRKSGQEREAVLAYFEDDGDIITMAMNGWGEAPPAWWLNLQAQPEAMVDLPGQEHRRVRAREASGEERERLWVLFRQLEKGSNNDLDALAALRSRPTPVVVLEAV